jgi:hypothetical protein
VIPTHGSRLSSQACQMRDRNVTISWSGTFRRNRRPEEEQNGLPDGLPAPGRPQARRQSRPASRRWGLTPAMRRNTGFGCRRRLTVSLFPARDKGRQADGGAFCCWSTPSRMSPNERQACLRPKHLSGPSEIALCRARWPRDPPNESGEGHDGRGDDVSPLNELILAPMGSSPV